MNKASAVWRRWERFAPDFVRHTFDLAADRYFWRGEKPQDAWHSFDRNPRRHPWLTTGNLAAMREFSVRVHRWAEKQAAMAGAEGRRYAFVGNMANGLYMRAVPLRRAGCDVDVFLHPQDRNVMSQPGWEEFNGVIPEGNTSLDHLAEADVRLPDVPGVHMIDQSADWQSQATGNPPAFLSCREMKRYADYMPLLPLLKALQPYDACLATQSQYLAWLARRPYLVTQSGGDIWYEASRGDLLGWLQRTAFRDANAFLFSNPWSCAHARRFGLNNLVYLPLILDETVYSPGDTRWREVWQNAVGGDFFVLSTARFDRFYKGSDMAIEAFAACCRIYPGLRLVTIGWGDDKDALLERMREGGLAGKVLVLPVAGKQRLIECLRSADCLLDQFNLGYYGATAIEAMACGLPVIMRIEHAQYAALLPAGAPPVLNASNPQEIIRHLSALAGSQENRRAAGDAARRWFLEAHGSTRWGPVYMNFLAATAMRKRPPYRGSPLRTRLRDKERSYHATELAAAPRFPRYQ